jgi:hypothetical protein
LCATHDAATITTVLVHGNRVSSSDAIAHGMAVYCQLSASVSDDSRLRHVIWSWPSDQIAGPLRDIRVKAERTTSEAFYLASLLSRLPPDARVSLIGHSFGVRIFTGSLHLLAGGSLGGRVLPHETADARMPVRGVAIAAALDHNWLYPGRRHGQALSMVDQLLVFYNPCDPVLKRFHWVVEGRSGTALGYSGLVCPQRLGEAGARVEQMNVGP